MLTEYGTPPIPLGASASTHPEAEARLRLVLSQEFLRTRLADDGGSGEVR